METKTQVKVNRALAKKVLKVVDAGLVRGIGNPQPGQMCVEAAVNYAMGHDHGDDPSCVGRAVRAFKIRLNDAAWPTNKDRTEGMRKLAIAQLGSDTINQREFANYVVIETVKRILPIALRAAASVIPAHQDALEGAAAACEVIVDISSARAAARAANEKAVAARNSVYAADAAYAYAAAAAAAVGVGVGVGVGADADAADADAAAYAAAAAAKRLKKGLEILKTCAAIGLEALQKLKSPGCEWLDLCE